MARGKLTEMQEKYVQNRVRGLPKQRAAVMAGYADVDKAGDQVEESVDVQQRIAELREETAQNCGFTKDMVAKGLKDAADMAKTMSDPTGMVAAWRELGKMLGFYAPEVRKVEKGINKKELRKALEDLSDEELLQLSRGRVIEGEFKRVDEKEVPLLPEK